MSTKPLLRVLMVAFVLVLAATLSLLHVKKISLAQNGDLVLTKTLNRSSNVVRVGEVLSFTIALTNQAGFTLTNVTLVDVYSYTVLGYAGAIPAPDAIATGVLTWQNVAVPPLAPNDSLTFTVFFTAEHPRTAVINYVRAQDITGTMGSISDSDNIRYSGEVMGGAAPMVKSLSPDSVPRVGFPLTFTHLITNDGAAFLTYLPLTDTYNANFLQFYFAIPTPTITSPPGLLVWTDLTTYFGDIPPFATVVVTTVFTATAQVVNSTVNSASVEGALDYYGNDLTAHEAQVPITIIDDTTRPSSNDDSDDDHEDETDRATPTPTLTPTPAQEITTGNQIDSSYPLYLPETGWLHDSHLVVPFLGIILLLFGWYLVKRSDEQ